MKTSRDTKLLKELRQKLTDASTDAMRGSEDKKTNELLKEVEKTLDLLRSKLFDAE